VKRDQVFCIIRDGAGVGTEANEVQGRIRIPQRLCVLRDGGKDGFIRAGGVIFSLHRQSRTSGVYSWGQTGIPRPFLSGSSGSNPSVASATGKTGTNTGRISGVPISHFLISVRRLLRTCSLSTKNRTRPSFPHFFMNPRCAPLGSFHACTSFTTHTTVVRGLPVSTRSTA